MMPGLKRSPVQVGEVVQVADKDYCYGTGILILRVTEVGPIQQQRDGSWISLYGLELRPDGSQKSSQPRHALVRVSGLRTRP